MPKHLPHGRGGTKRAIPIPIAAAVGGLLRGPTNTPVDKSKNKNKNKEEHSRSLHHFFLFFLYFFPT